MSLSPCWSLVKENIHDVSLCCFPHRKRSWRWRAVSLNSAEARSTNYSGRRGRFLAQPKWLSRRKEHSWISAPFEKFAGTRLELVILGWEYRKKMWCDESFGGSRFAKHATTRIDFSKRGMAFLLLESQGKAFFDRRGTTTLDNLDNRGISAESVTIPCSIDVKSCAIVMQVDAVFMPVYK